MAWRQQPSTPCVLPQNHRWVCWLALLGIREATEYLSSLADPHTAHGGLDLTAALIAATSPYHRELKQVVPSLGQTGSSSSRARGLCCSIKALPEFPRDKMRGLSLCRLWGVQLDVSHSFDSLWGKALPVWGALLCPQLWQWAPMRVTAGAWPLLGQGERGYQGKQGSVWTAAVQF